MKSFLLFKNHIITKMVFLIYFVPLLLYGQTGNYLNFDGTNDYVNLSGISLSGGSFTLEAWIKIGTIPESSEKRFIISVGSSSQVAYEHSYLYFLGSKTSGHLFIKSGLFGADITYDWIYNTDWNHIAFTFDNNSKHGIIYLNGSNVISQLFVSGLTGTGVARIGSRSWSGTGEYFSGDIDEVRIWNVARSSAEITDNYTNFSLDPSSAGLVAYYKFNQGTGGADNTGTTTLDDETSNNHNGSLINFALTGSSSNWMGASPLPVELTSFSGTPAPQKIILNWQTATEVDNYGFEIQRAEGSVKKSESAWQNIGFVYGHGNSNSVKDYSFADETVGSGKYSYRLKQIDTDGGFKYSAVIEVEINYNPTEFSLEQNYPNPFNPVTKIKYSIPNSLPASLVTLKIFDIMGSEITSLVNEVKTPGVYEVEWNASFLSSGVYFCTLKAGSFTALKKLMLMK